MKHLRLATFALIGLTIAGGLWYATSDTAAVWRWKRANLAAARSEYTDLAGKINLSEKSIPAFFDVNLAADRLIPWTDRNLQLGLTAWKRCDPIDRPTMLFRSLILAGDIALSPTGHSPNIEIDLREALNAGIESTNDRTHEEAFLALLNLGWSPAELTPRTPYERQMSAAWTAGAPLPERTPTK